MMFVHHNNTCHVDIRCIPLYARARRSVMAIKDVRKGGGVFVKSGSLRTWGFGEMQTSAKLDINLDKKLSKFDIATRFQCELDFNQCQL